MSSWSSSYLEHAASALQSLSHLRSRHELCDVILSVGTRHVFAHRSVLAASCPYFRAMFTSGLSECDKECVVLKEVDGAAVEALVDFIYTSDLHVCVDNVENLLAAADCLQLTTAKATCAEFLKQHLTVPNCLEICEFAERHSCVDLECAARSFAHNNFSDVAQTDGFLLVTYESFKKLVTSDFLRIKNEEEVFEAVTNWVKYDLSSRRQHFSGLLSHVRLPFVSVDFLADRIAADSLVQEDDICQQLVEEAFTYLLSPKQRPLLAYSSHRARPRRTSTLRQKLIAAGGQSIHGTMHSIEQYNPELDEWHQMPDLEFDRYGFALVCCDGQVYALGGCSSSSGFQTAIEVFDFQEQRWETVMDMKPIRYFGAIESCGVIYVTGGHNGITALSSLECFDPSTGEWITLSSMSSKRLYPGISEMGGHLFVVGGHCGKARLDSVECYSIERDEWQVVASLPAPSSVVATVSLGSHIYAIGGYTGESHLSSVNIYDPVINEWTMGPSLLLPRSAAAAVECEGCVYVCGGFSGTFLNSVERLDPRTRDWCKVATMTLPRAHFAATVL